MSTAFVAAALVLLTAPSASAQSETPDRGPNGTPVPAPPVPPGRDPTDSSSSMPPFAAPLPPAVPLPPPIVVPPATPPPRYEPPPNPWTISTIPPRATPPAPRQLSEAPDYGARSAGGLRQALDEYDRRLGLAPGGGVVSAARALAMSEPVDGSARLEIVVDSTGRILRSSVVDASQNTEAWRALADALQDVRLKGMQGRASHGTWMLVDVSATVQPSSGRTRWWAPGVMLVFDVADIGARTMRVVHANVASQLSF